MSAIPDDDLERIARLLMGSGETNELRSKIMRLLRMDDDTCRAPKLPQNKPPIH
jgi:hypothetical protein